MKGKEIVTLFLFALLAVSLPAQQKKNTKSLQSETNASRIMDYTNSVIRLSNAHIDAYMEYAFLLESAAWRMERIKTSSTESLPEWEIKNDTCAIDPILNLLYDTKLDYLPKTFKGKAELVKSVKTAKENGAKINKHSRALNNYFVNKEYENDAEGFPLYNKLYDSLIVNIGKTRKSWRKASHMALEAAEEAEKVFLQKNPLAKVISPMKADIKSVQNLINITFPEDGNPDWSSVVGNTQSLVKAFEKGKKGENRNLNILGPPKLKEYGEFYDSCLKFTETINALSEAAKQPYSKAVMQNHYKNITEAFQKVSDNYIEFIRL